MRVLIIGGGVAGIVAALAAQRAGLSPAVFEAYPAGTAGVFLTVATNGIDALRAVSADHIVTAAGFPSRTMQFFSGTGKRLGALGLGPETRSIRRADLHRGLAELAAARGIPINHDRRLVTAVESADGVRAVFADGSHADGDLLIGADGVHSVVRGLIAADNPGPRYLGLGNVGGFTTGVPPLGEVGDYRMYWGRECFFGALTATGGETWWFANPRSREPVPRDTAGASVRARIAALLDPDDTPAAAIVRAGHDELRITNQYDVPVASRWHTDRMVIIGDAAHALSPTSGQGASLAAEDGVLLARCLRDAPALPAALAAFTAVRRPRVSRVARETARMNSTKRQGALTRAVRDAMLPVLFRWMDTPRQAAKRDWLHRHHIDWSSVA